MRRVVTEAAVWGHLSGFVVLSSIANEVMAQPPSEILDQE